MSIVFNTKFFDIRIVEKVGNHNHYVIMNKPDAIAVLGYINWFPRWRKYVFTTNHHDVTIFDATCLKDIVKFLESLEEK